MDVKINVDNAKLHIYILDKASRYYDKTLCNASRS